MRPATLGLFLFSFLSTGFLAHASSVDSVRAIVTPVQCYGLRNGVIQDTVFGGERPFFLSPRRDKPSPPTSTFDHLRPASTCCMSVMHRAVRNWPVKVKEPAELQVKLLVSETTVVAGESLYLLSRCQCGKRFLHQIEWRPPSLFTRQDTLSKRSL